MQVIAKQRIEHIHTNTRTDKQTNTQTYRNKHSQMQVIAKAGQGAFGSVYVAMWKGLVVAVKVGVGPCLHCLRGLRAISQWPQPAPCSAEGLVVVVKVGGGLGASC